MDFLATVNFSAILPEIILAITGMIVLLVEIFLPRDKGEVGAVIGLVGLVAATITCFPLNKLFVIFSGSYVVDYYSLFFKTILITVTALTTLISISYLELIHVNQGEFYALLIFSTLGLVIMVSGLDLITIYLGLEMAAMASCALVGFMVKDKKSNEAALKYFMLNVFASGILLYGISWLYGITGKLGLQDIADYLQSYIHLNNPGLQFSLLLLIVSFGFKIAYVPFHMWVPDVYEGAPTSAAAFLSLGPKVAGLAVLLRLFMRALAALIPVWTGIFWLLAALTMTAGNVIALRQENLKRMLGYSGIAHVGYMLIAAAAIGKAPQLGTAAILLYLFAYTFINLGPFGVIILLCHGTSIGDRVEDFNGLSKYCPTAALAMTVFMFSLAGIPPTGGFIAKFLVFASAMKSELFWLALIGVLNSAIAIFYYLRVVVAMYMEEPIEGAELTLSRSLIIGLSIMVFFSLLIGVFPAIFIQVARNSVAAMF